VYSAAVENEGSLYYRIFDRRQTIHNGPGTFEREGGQSIKRALTEVMNIVTFV